MRTDLRGRQKLPLPAVRGEQFTFIGDDDVWIFINGRLATDLGGLHTEVGGVIDLDINTNLSFTDCGTTIAPDIR
jgi:fibro-slime domain-containing protein